jgi:hypothetical protein
MKIYSYNNPHYESAAKKFDDSWPIQFLQGYSNFYEKEFSNEIILLEDAKTLACIPLKLFNSRIFKFGQILHAPVKDGVELNVEEQKIFLENLIHYLKSNRLVHRMVQPHPMGFMKYVPIGARSCAFGTYITELQEFDDEALLNSFDPKYKKAIQHSIKNGGRCEFGWKNFDMFYKIYSGTMTRAGLPIEPTEYFENLRKNIGDDHIEVGVVYDIDQPIGCILLMYSKYAAYCTHAGSGGESKLYGAVKQLHYEMMRRLRDKGVKKYDLVGVRLNSKDDSLQGIFRFKKGFGGTLKEGYLWKKDITKTPMAIYDTLLKIKLGNKLNKDIIDQEAKLNLS